MECDRGEWMGGVLTVDDDWLQANDLEKSLANSMHSTNYCQFIAPNYYFAWLMEHLAAATANDSDLNHWQSWMPPRNYNAC